MTEDGSEAGRTNARALRNVSDLAPGFEQAHEDKLLDEYLDEFLSTGVFPDTSLERWATTERKTHERILKLFKLEHNDESRAFCTELRNKIHTHFSGEEQTLLLEAMKYVLRVHIDDKDRIDTGLPGVSHQLKVSLNVLDVLLVRNPDYKQNASILAAAMLHDIVEDHTRLLLLEKKNLMLLRGKLRIDGSKVIPNDASPTDMVIALLESEGGIAGKPNRVLGHLIRALTLDRASLLTTWDGLTRDDAIDAITELERKSSDPEVQKRKDDKKRELYVRYGQDTITDPSLLGEAASLIKIKDWEDNALTIGLIRERYRVLSLRGDEASQEEALKLRDTYNKMQLKYRPMLEDAVSLLETWDRATWVGGIADTLRPKILDVLKNEYMRPL